MKYCWFCADHFLIRVQHSATAVSASVDNCASAGGAGRHKRSLARLLLAVLINVRDLDYCTERWVGTIEGRGLEANQPSNTSQGMKFDNKNKRTCDVVT